MRLVILYRAALAYKGSLVFALVVAALAAISIPLVSQAALAGGGGGCLPRRYVAEVVRVIDGDTLVLRVLIPEWGIKTHHRVRLLGMDAPEITAREAKERRRAREAKGLVKKLIGPSGMVEVTSPRCARGYYGRPLVHIRTMDGKDLAESLKKAGLEKGG